MEELTTTIWSHVDKLLKKPLLKKPNNTYTCKECNGTKVFSKEGMPTCSECGLVDSMFIDESPEWTSGISDDGKVNDPSRCGGPNANPNSQIGVGRTPLFCLEASLMSTIVAIPTVLPGNPE